MGDKPSRPGTLDPAIQDMIDRYVSEALHSTGTRRPPLEPLSRARTARGSEPPTLEFDDEVTAVFARAPTHDTLYER